MNLLRTVEVSNSEEMINYLQIVGLEGLQSQRIETEVARFIVIT